MSIGSKLYIGSIRHRRFMPIIHEFNYKICMWWLDLDDHIQVLKANPYCGYESFNWISFRRKDYFEPNEPNLKQAVIMRVNQERIQQGLAQCDIKRICMLTHLRYLNIIFNPVTFYYCFDKDNALVSILAEITNTPWGERHSYILPIHNDDLLKCYSDSQGDVLSQCKEARYQEFKFNKRFHVSPFNPMNMNYRWVFSKCFESSNERFVDPALRVHMDNIIKDNQHDTVKHFDATLILNPVPMSKYGIRTLIQFPIETVKVVVGIYWQALKLALKKSPFYSHPKYRKVETKPTGEAHDSSN